MSKALKCDRCGCCFDPMSGDGTAEFVEFRNPIFRTAKNIKLKDIRRCLIPDAPIDDPLDLCPSCAREFEAFMHCDYESNDQKLMENAQEITRLKSLNNALEADNAKLRLEINEFVKSLFFRSSNKADSESSNTSARFLKGSKPQTNGLADFRNVIFYDKSTAEKVLDKLQSYVKEYAPASVADFLNEARLPVGDDINRRFGWRDLDSAELVSTYDDNMVHCWRISFPMIHDLTTYDPAKFLMATATDWLKNTIFVKSDLNTTDDMHGGDYDGDD